LPINILRERERRKWVAYTTLAKPSSRWSFSEKVTVSKYVTMAWHVLRLQEEELAFIYGE
jgi:hypothetical protein